MSTKKEEQRRIKQEKQTASEHKHKLQSLLMKGVLAVLIPLVAGVLLYGFFTAGQTVPPGAVTDTDHVRGERSANVTMTVYADFQCPACGEESQIIARAWPRLRDKVALVFRHYPLDGHAHAFTAARYTEAAARQNKFWELHDLLYADQALWSVVGDATTLFDGYATQLALDLDRLHADMELSEVRNKILADQRGGVSAGVLGTPTIFLNGRVVANPRSPTELIAMVEKAAAEAE